MLGRFIRPGIRGLGSPMFALAFTGLTHRVGLALRVASGFHVARVAGLAARVAARRVASGRVAFGRVARDRLALHDVAAAALGRTLVRPVAPRAAAAGAAVSLGLGVAMGAFLLVDQRLPVGDGDLVVVGMDFAEGEEAVAIAAVIHEGGLKRRLDARYLGEIDVTAKLLAVG